MVTPAGLKQRTRAAWRFVVEDVRGVWRAVKPSPEPKPGLYVYHFFPVNGERQVHLRIEADGRAVLWIDVTDVVYLNSTAAYLAKLALDGVSADDARRMLRRHFQGGSRAEFDRAIAEVNRMVATIADSTASCTTCDLADLPRSSLFSRRANAPFKADLALTYGCNNSCAHCYNEADRFEMPSLPADDWFAVIDRLVDIGVPHFIFTGGEATLHPDLPRLIAAAHRRGVVVGLNTNGRRLAHRPFVRELIDAGLNHVQITLASHDETIHNAVNGADAFRQTVAGIESALAEGLHAITNTTVMRQTASGIEQTVEFLHGLGLRTFAMNGMIDSGGGFRDPQAVREEELAPLLIQIRDRAAELGMRFLWYTPTEYCRMSPVELEIGAKRCNAGEYSICIEPNGDVLPCQSFYVSAGNLLRDPWESIWNGRLFREFRDRDLDPAGSGLPVDCWECPDLPLCGGGCRIEREARDGLRTASAGGRCSTNSSPALVQLTSYQPGGRLVDATERATGNR